VSGRNKRKEFLEFFPRRRHSLRSSTGEIKKLEILEAKQERRAMLAPHPRRFLG
jgi:hypothetical protein